MVYAGMSGRKLRPVTCPMIEAKFPMEQTADAHALMAGNDTVGKILLTL